MNTPELICLEVEDAVIQVTMHVHKGKLLVSIPYMGEYKVNVNSIRQVAARVLAMTEEVNHK